MGRALLKNDHEFDSAKLIYRSLFVLSIAPNVDLTPQGLGSLLSRSRNKVSQWSRSAFLGANAVAAVSTYWGSSRAFRQFIGHLALEPSRTASEALLSL